MRGEEVRGEKRGRPGAAGGDGRGRAEVLRARGVEARDAKRQREGDPKQTRCTRQRVTRREAGTG